MTKSNPQTQILLHSQKFQETWEGERPLCATHVSQVPAAMLESQSVILLAAKAARFTKSELESFFGTWRLDARLRFVSWVLYGCLSHVFWCKRSGRVEGVFVLKPIPRNCSGMLVSVALSLKSPLIVGGASLLQLEHAALCLCDGLG